MNIPDEAAKWYPPANPPTHDDWRQDALRSAFIAGAEWALREAADVVDNMRPEVGSHINVGPYRYARHVAFTEAADRIRALAEGEGK